MKRAEEITLFYELAPEFCFERGLSLPARYFAKVFCRYLADEPWRAGAKISETKDESLCFKGEDDFILLVKEKHEDKANTGRRWGRGSLWNTVTLGESW